MPKTDLSTYPRLLKRIQTEIASGQKAIEQTRAETYWKVGRHIHTHILKRKERAGYDKQVMKRLAKDLDVNATTLYRSIEFFRAFPKFAARQNLGWTHYKQLLSIKDPAKRGRLLARADAKGLSTRDLAREIKQTKLTTEHRPLTTTLKEPTRGPLCVYKAESGSDGYIYVDLGFHITRQVKSRKKVVDGDIIQFSKASQGFTIQLSTAGKKDLYTYRAYLERVIDGDTLSVNIDLGFDTFLKETVRLKSIDAPELKTKKGDRAKRYVTRKLKAAHEIIIKTTYEDKYGRYLADVWVDGVYLNQKLLDQGLAEGYNNR